MNLRYHDESSERRDKSSGWAQAFRVAIALTVTVIVLSLAFRQVYKIGVQDGIRYTMQQFRAIPQREQMICQTSEYSSLVTLMRPTNIGMR